MSFRSSDASQPSEPTAHDADPGRDVATQTRDVGVPDVAQDLAIQDAPLGADVAGAAVQDAPLGVDNSAAKDGAAGADACVPLTCHEPKCEPYCGTIGDGCGGTLNCGDACPTGWPCEQGICRYVPFDCAWRGCTFWVYNYCGLIGDPCGGALDCGTTCPTPGWQCVDSLCVGPPDVCEPLSCDSSPGSRYCGVVGDGCGGILDCGTTCPMAGWVCENSICVDVSGGCIKVDCAPPQGGRYCGVIEDGCGRGQDCGTTCPDGSTCGQTRAHICGDATLPDPPLAIPPYPPPAPPPPAPCPPPPMAP